MCFRCCNDSEHFIVTSVTLRSLYFLHVLLLYIFPEKRENKRDMALKTSLQEAVPSFPHRGPDPDSIKVSKSFPFHYTTLSKTNKQACCHVAHVATQPTQAPDSNFMAIFFILYFCTPSYFDSFQHKAFLFCKQRQLVIIQLNNTTAEADSSLLICAEFSFP